MIDTMSVLPVWLQWLVAVLTIVAASASAGGWLCSRRKDMILNKQVQVHFITPDGQEYDLGLTILRRYLSRAEVYGSVFAKQTPAKTIGDESPVGKDAQTTKQKKQNQTETQRIALEGLSSPAFFCSLENAQKNLTSIIKIEVTRDDLRHFSNVIKLDTGSAERE
ncbi:MAG: hypothetical protein LBH87_03460 [Coriobacteriales bacterium]|jgi:hypothetical protein|nr:hypothetical protein [Coriobacteriales bacterium]